MVTADLSRISIEDESTEKEVRFQLYINDNHRGLVTKRGGTVQFHFAVFGPQYWPEAKALMQGLLELSIIADRLSGEEK